jgi:type IV secretory pathway VirD2 relaxase
MSEKEFKPRLGRIGHAKSVRPKTFYRQVMEVAYKNGFKARRKSSFTGQRIGRGAAMGTLAAAGMMGNNSRRAVIKVRIAKLKPGKLAAPRAHMRYVQRDGVTLSGEPGQLYSKDLDIADGAAFTERCDGDRHQFRIIVSPDDAEQLADLKPFVRDLMSDMEKDLDTKLDWMAVDHFNTGHFHTHIVIRGKDENGKDLIIARDYITHGIRERASQLLTLELGPEDDFQKTLKLVRQVEHDRFTQLDRSILKHMDQGYLVISSMPPSEPAVHAANMRRLRHLKNMNLAREMQTGVWQIDPDMERKLRSLGQRDDIMKTMYRAMREAGIDRHAGDFAIFRANEPNSKIVGKVAAIGLTDGVTDSHYVVIDGVDGRVHYADIGPQRPGTLPDKGMIVSLEATAQDTNARQQLRIRVLSYLNFETLSEFEGATWLDKELASRSPTSMRDQGFGAEVKTSLRNRMRWLAERGLTQVGEVGTQRFTTSGYNQLKTGELRQTVAAMENRSGLTFNPLVEGERFEGSFNHTVKLASGKFAVFENSKEFVLVPWKPSFEDFRRRQMDISAGPERSWEITLGRGRGLGIG